MLNNRLLKKISLYKQYYVKVRQEHANIQGILKEETNYDQYFFRKFLTNMKRKEKLCKGAPK